MSSNPAEAQDLLMEAGYVLAFVREAVNRAGDSDEPVHETCGLSYVLSDVSDRLQKADKIIDAYKAERGNANG